MRRTAVDVLADWSGQAHDIRTWRIRGEVPTTHELELLRRATLADYIAADVIAAAERAVLVEQLRLLAEPLADIAERRGDLAEADRLRCELLRVEERW